MNPILNWLKEPISPQHFPFDLVTPKVLKEALEEVLTLQKDEILNLLNSSNQLFSNFLYPVFQAQYQVQMVWDAIIHLKNVLGTKEYIELYELKNSEITLFFAEVYQHPKFVEKVKYLSFTKNKQTLNVLEQKVIEDLELELRLEGAFLKPVQQKEMITLKQKLALLSSQFSNNILAETEAYQLSIDDPKIVARMPKTILEQALKTSHKKNVNSQEKPVWTFTLDIVSYTSMMKYCRDEKTRQKMYQAYHCRCLQGVHSNKENAFQILNLRLKLAQLLGFKSYTEYSLATKMANSKEEILQFFEELYQKSIPKAKQEYKILGKLKKQVTGNEAGVINAWDVTFYAERYKEQNIKIEEEELKEYLPLAKVLQGMFKIVTKLYGIQFKVKRVPTWYESVVFYQVFQNDQLIAGIYFDLHLRLGKQEGAWMDEQTRLYHLPNKNKVLPIAYVNCNFSESNEQGQTLLNYLEVETLFHEMGHALHHILTKIDCLPVSGITGVPWDAVEVPSQFFENWIWDLESIAYFSSHLVTQKQMPLSIIKKLLMSKNFMSGMQMLRQIDFSVMDLLLHSQTEEWKSVEQLDTFVKEIHQKYCLYPLSNEDLFYPTFSHVFCGGYAAGYYSYKWAEVLSADCFSAFKNKLFETRLSQKFLDEILSQGGSQPFMKLFYNFRGREPLVQPLLDSLEIN